MVSDESLDKILEGINDFCKTILTTQKNQLLKLRNDVKSCKDKKVLKELLGKKESDFKQLDKSYNMMKKYLDE